MSYDPLDTKGQEYAKADRDTRDKLARETEDADIKWIMGSKRGRRIVWRLLEKAGVFRLSFNTNSMMMAFNEGNRNYGNRLLAQVNALCPELYPVMVKEAKDERNNADDGHRGCNDHGKPVLI